MKLLLFIGVLVLVQGYRELTAAKRLLKCWVEDALSEFRAINVSSASSQFSLSGSAAEVVGIETTGGVSERGAGRAGFTVVIYARNPEGEYFVFRKTGIAKPYIKHMEHATAKVVLKSKYQQLN